MTTIPNEWEGPGSTFEDFLWLDEGDSERCAVLRTFFQQELHPEKIASLLRSFHLEHLQAPLTSPADQQIRTQGHFNDHENS